MGDLTEENKDNDRLSKRITSLVLFVAFCKTEPAMKRSYLGAVKAFRLAGIFMCLLVSAQRTYAEEPALAQKIRDISPNKKFAMRIWYDAETYQKMFPTEKSDAGKTSAALQRGIREEYFSAAIKAIELVSLPKRSIVAELPWDGTAEQMSFTWSRDSRWCAFYAETARWGLTWVYHLRAGKFLPLGEDVQPGGDVERAEHGTWRTPLEIEVEGDVRRQWLKPIRWVKPGVLLLEQSVIFRAADAGQVTYRLTAAFNEETGKFQIISKEKVPSKE
jgi:KaiC/GvpD/RAD55 family RecA-like ATPase